MALNASIEAARAGDYGRGYAVVADNIRRLSHETKQSLEDVNHIITDLRSSLACSITEIITSIQQVASVVEDSAASAKETSASTEEQTATKEQLSASAQQMSNLGEDLMVLVKQFNLD